MIVEPMPHQTLKGAWRVPVVVIDRGDTYEVYIHSNYLLRYESKKLPNSIRMRLSMIHAIPTPKQISKKAGALSDHSMYINYHDKRLDEIGWQSGADTYIVVLEQKEFMRLRGTLQRT